MGHLGALESVGFEALAEIVLELRQAHRIVRKINKYQTMHELDGYPLQRMAGLIHVFGKITRSAKISVEIVSPTMVRADKGSRGPPGRHAYPRSPMPADVDQRIYVPVPVPHDDDRFTGHLEQEKIARLADLAVMARVEPASKKYLLKILLEYVPGSIESLFQRKAPFVSF